MNADFPVCGCTHDELPVQTLKHAGNEMEIKLNTASSRRVLKTETDMKPANTQN